MERWQSKAACLGADPDIFFPPQYAGRGANDRAKAICKPCEVREECLDDAMENGERMGVWGGMSERERRKLKKARRASPQSNSVTPPDPVPTHEPMIVRHRPKITLPIPRE
jgi:WhiB family transcriptional regulator, redox-sensing transcriptional regulator